MGEQVSETPERWDRGTCVLCSNGCGLYIGVKGGKIVGVRGLATDATNKGRLGPKGLHGWVANDSPDRLTRPLIRKEGRLQQASWDEAMDLIVQKSKETVEKHTSGAMGFYTSGQLFLEEDSTLGVIGDTRETSADGDLPGLRNWGNPEHTQQLAKLWNVPFNKIPHWSPPTHAMQIVSG